jgi:hypothetical protein
MTGDGNKIPSNDPHFSLLFAVLSLSLLFLTVMALPNSAG